MTKLFVRLPARELRGYAPTVIAATRWKTFERGCIPKARPSFAQRSLHTSPVAYKSNWLKKMLGITEEKEQEMLHSNKENRDKITTELSKGYFKDYAEIKKNGGKRFQAPDALTPVPQAYTFPTMHGKTIAGTSVTLPREWRGKVTLVLLGCRGYCKPMLDAYEEQFTAAFGTERKCQVFTLWIVEQAIFRKIMGSMFENSIRKTMPDVGEQERTICYLGSDVPQIKQHLDIFNAITGYAFLVDKHGRVRWQAHGYPDAEEIVTLKRGVSELLSSSR
eukprot:m.253864 g.253864  ORF g.253864 m.253864 type:complete len:277 (-) comp19596_c0_seq1:1196-2026(-)